MIQLRDSGFTARRRAATKSTGTCQQGKIATTLSGDRATQRARVTAQIRHRGARASGVRTVEAVVAADDEGGAS